MKTNLNKELTYFILGLPRSGTTIVASLFNSLDDGFCLGEPHWYVEAGHAIEEVGSACCGKVGHLWDRAGVDDPEAIYSDFIRPAVTIGGYKLGGYKETWRGDPLGRWLLEKHIPRVDFFVTVHRDPQDVWQSQLKCKWPGKEWTLKRAIDGACQLYELNDPKAVVIGFEAFRRDPLGTVNRALDGRFEIKGPVTLRPTGWVFGDPKANKSTEVK